MAYKFDKSTGDIIVYGFEQGIADSPYEGISDIRNANLISVPGEASVNFSTTKITPTANVTRTVTSADAGADTVTVNSVVSLEKGMCITFSASTVGGISTSTPYWIGAITGSSFSLYTTYDLSGSVVDITSNGTGTFTVLIPGTIKYFTYNRYSDGTWAIDSNGRTWSNDLNASQGTTYWRYMGNTTLTNANGNGIVYYEASNGGSTIDRYIFIWRNGLIDYIKNVDAGGATWVYGWNPADGTSGNTGTVLKTQASTNNPHMAIVAPDNKVYYCDGAWIGRFYQSDPTVTFNPATTTTYTFDNTKVLPYTDISQCIAPLGNNLLVGGKLNIIYPWDTFSNLPQYPILVPEYNIQGLVTVNTNTFIQVGNRGRIYVTNGSQAQLFKKVPDHLSGTVEPYFTWGGFTSTKNQLYFGIYATTNSGTAINQYGGVWAIDLDTKALRLTNKLSYQTYAGYASAIIPNFATNPAGTGLFIGWYDGVEMIPPNCGIDTTSSTPYSNDECTLDTDLIPIGTFLKPTTNTRVEFKLAVPLTSADNIRLQYRQKFSDSYTDITNGYFIFSTNGSGNTYSGVCTNLNFENSQWLQIRAVMNTVNTSGSYVRLKEIRIGN